MNIKGFGVNNLTPLESRQKAEAKGDIKSQQSSDRDADGRRQDGNQKQDEPLTEEMIQQAMEYLESHPGVKDNQLTVKKTKAAGQVMLLVEDHLGKVVRRIPQSQIHLLAQGPADNPAKGQLYDRAG